MSDYNLRCDCGEYVIVRALEEDGFQTSERCTSCGRNWRLVYHSGQFEKSEWLDGRGRKSKPGPD